MRTLVRVVLAAAALACLPSLAEAKVRIQVDLDKQTIHVDAGAKTYDWKVSSGKPGYATPSGSYRVLWMDKDHHSDEYEQAYMPNAIFFAPGFAIHGFGKSPWGHAASHGCVRLPMDKSAILFDLVKAQGADITLTGGGEPSLASQEKAKGLLEAARHGDTAAPAPDAYYDDARAYQEVPRNGAYQEAPRGNAPLEMPAQAPAPAPVANGSLFGSIF